MTEQGLLVIAPHPDDETLGAGGTMARCAASGLPVTILTVAAHMPPLYSEAVHQQTVAEARKAHGVLGVSDSRFLDFPAVSVRDRPVALISCRALAIPPPGHQRFLQNGSLFWLRRHLQEMG